MVTVLRIELLMSDPNLRNGQPIIIGTALRVVEVVAYHQQGKPSYEDIAKIFFVQPSEVYISFAYYLDHEHKTDLDTVIEQEKISTPKWFTPLYEQAANLSPDLKEAVARLDDEQLWKMAYTKLSWDDQQRLDYLNKEADERDLTSGELEGLETLIKKVNALALLRSHALAILKNRGYDIDRLVLGKTE